jgi:molybdenum cofactor guanylyltransferase
MAFLRAPRHPWPRVRQIEICILAGGLSTRMRRDKTRVRLGRRTLLGHVRAAAAELCLPVRVLRRDLIPRCGPIGGVYSALKTSKADAILFLPCDMPFLDATLLWRVTRQFTGDRALFANPRGTPGFPFVLSRSMLPVVERQIAKDRLALHELAKALRARMIRLPVPATLNINNPEDLAEAKKRHNSAQDQLVKKR